MKTILILILASAFAVPAWADSGAVWNYERVLGMSRPAFTRLCKNESGKISKPKKNMVHCMTPKAESADVLVSFENGHVSIHGMIWNDAAVGLDLLGSLRKELGAEDRAVKEDGCRNYWWVGPAGEPYIYMLSLCSNTTRIVVAPL